MSPVKYGAETLYTGNIFTVLPSYKNIGYKETLLVVILSEQFSET